MVHFIANASVLSRKSQLEKLQQSNPKLLLLSSLFLNQHWMLYQNVEKKNVEELKYGFSMVETSKCLKESCYVVKRANLQATGVNTKLKVRSGKQVG